jgi:hypothetical protein
MPLGVAPSSLSGRFLCQEQLDGLLSGVEIELSNDMLDRIDEIVPPGTDLDPADNYAATPPAIENASLRRR